MSAKRRYIAVTPFFPSPENWRGAYCYDFVKALSSALGSGWSVDVFVPGEGGEYDVAGLHVRRFPVKALPSNILPFLFEKPNRASFLRAVAEAGIDIADVAVCHAHTANFAPFALAAKDANPECRTFLHHHDLMSFGLNNGRLRHWGAYNRFAARGLKRLHEAIDCHVFISRLCEKSFRSFPSVDWLGIPDYSAQARGARSMRPVAVKSSIVLHNGVDVSLFNPGPGGAKPDGETLVVGCVGNVSREKGQRDLVEAARIAEDALRRERAAAKIELRFVGSGPDLAHCRALARKLGVNAEFLPEVRHELLPDFYRTLDLFALPTHYDGFGCVYTEAYACGVPFIATDKAGAAELIPECDRDVWLAKPGDAADLAGKIARFARERPRQTLTGEIAIDALVRRFVREAEFDR